MSAAVESTAREVETANVVGMVGGAARPDEFITVTAHYDHFGVGEAIDGDSIYNGAYDNASGTALLMEMARAAAGLEAAPERSILFIATAAEEQGLLDLLAGAHQLQYLSIARRRFRCRLCRRLLGDGLRQFRTTLAAERRAFSLSLIHISEPTRPPVASRMPSSA